MSSDNCYEQVTLFLRAKGLPKIGTFRSVTELIVLFWQIINVVSCLVREQMRLPLSFVLIKILTKRYRKATRYVALPYSRMYFSSRKLLFICSLLQEVVPDNEDPDWATTFTVNYHFENVQEVK